MGDVGEDVAANEAGGKEGGSQAEAKPGLAEPEFEAQGKEFWYWFKV